MVSSGSLQSNSKQPGEERKIKSKSSDSEKVLVAAESFIYKFLNSHKKTLNFAEPNSQGKQKNGLSWGGGKGGGSSQVIRNDQNQLLFRVTELTEFELVAFHCNIVQKVIDSVEIKLYVKTSTLQYVMVTIDSSVL